MTIPTSPLTWTARISLLRSAVVLKQLLFVMAVASGSVLCLMIGLQALDGQLTLASLGQFVLIALGLFAGSLLLSGLALLLVYGGHYEYTFTVDAQGVHAVTSGGTRKRNRVINLLLLLTGRPTAMGAGLLADSRQSQTLRWSDFDGLSANPGAGEIALRKGRRVVMLVQCTPENYVQVLDLLETRRDIGGR